MQQSEVFLGIRIVQIMNYKKNYLDINNIRTIEDIENLNNEDLLLLKGILFDKAFSHIKETSEYSEYILQKKFLKELEEKTEELKENYKEKNIDYNNIFEMIKFIELYKNKYIFLSHDFLNNIAAAYMNEEDSKAFMKEIEDEYERAKKEELHTFTVWGD